VGKVRWRWRTTSRMYIPSNTSPSAAGE
jgi:hypothetical protein